MEKLLPQNIEAEQSVLGSIIIDPDAIALVANFLKPDHFYRDAHRDIYEVILSLYGGSHPADFIAICDELGRRNKLEAVGGASYITSLVNVVPTSGNAEYYGNIVERKAILRMLVHAAGKIAAIAYEETEDALDQAEKLIYGISHQTVRGRGDERAGDILNRIWNEIMAPNVVGGAITGVPSGLHDLDILTLGFQKSDLIILAGRPSMGKTSLALTIARNAAADYNRSVYFVSAEMGREQLVKRLVAHDARVDLQRLRSRQMSDEDRDRIVTASPSIFDMDLYIEDTPGISVLQMRSNIRRRMAQQDIDLIIVDYLGRLNGLTDQGRYLDRVQEVSGIARALKNMAREFDVPVLALAQLNRAVEGRQVKVPQLSDLRDSGEIEQEADIVIFIHRDDYYAGTFPDGSSRSTRPGTADLIVAKQRNGPFGEVCVGFDASQTRYYTLESPGPNLTFTQDEAAFNDD